MSIRTVIRSSLVAATLCACAVPSAFAQSAAEKLDALDKRITRLEDLNQIERLQRTYGYFVDKSQWRQLAELFSDDATLEIGGKGLFTGKPRVLEYMQTAFGMDGAKEGSLANHMQFQSIPDISADGKRGWIRSRAYVMSLGGWGLPLVARGGTLLAMKGSSAPEEVAAARPALDRWRASAEVVRLSVPGSSTTTVVRVVGNRSAAIGWRPSGAEKMRLDRRNRS